MASASLVSTFVSLSALPGTCNSPIEVVSNLPPHSAVARGFTLEHLGSGKRRANERRQHLFRAGISAKAGVFQQRPGPAPRNSGAPGLHGGAGEPRGAQEPAGKPHAIAAPHQPRVDRGNSSHYFCFGMRRRSLRLQVISKNSPLETPPPLQKAIWHAALYSWAAFSWRAVRLGYHGFSWRARNQDFRQFQ